MFEFLQKKIEIQKVDVRVFQIGIIFS